MYGFKLAAIAALVLVCACALSGCSGAASAAASQPSDVSFGGIAVHNDPVAGIDIHIPPPKKPLPLFSAVPQLGK
jgi:hypothetical protein